jgi:maleylacetoacetate isomerase
VRIALGLKGLAYDNTFVHLTRGGGEQFAPSYKALNPQGLVPALEDEGVVMTQSLAILEYLDEKYPSPAPLIPAYPHFAQRARVRALAQSICCDIHPLNNLRVLKAITNDFAASEEQKTAWITKWISTGFAALETELARSPHTGTYCHGETPTLVDCCLVPQVFSARRFHVDLSAYPTITRIDAACNALPAFIASQPKNQPDFEA